VRKAHSWYGVTAMMCQYSRQCSCAIRAQLCLLVDSSFRTTRISGVPSTHLSFC
jgi:hypothetical protein